MITVRKLMVILFILVINLTYAQAQDDRSYGSSYSNKDVEEARQALKAAGKIDADSKYLKEVERIFKYIGGIGLFLSLVGLIIKMANKREDATKLVLAWTFALIAYIIWLQ